MPRLAANPLTYLALLLAMLLWASSFVALKYAFESFDPWFVIFARMAVASLFVLLLFPRLFRGVRIRPVDAKILLVMALFEPGFYFVFEAEALQNTTASQAGMITALLPIMVALGAWLWMGERLTSRTIVGGLLAFAGAVWLSLAAETSRSAPHPLYGNFMEFLAMVTAVGYTLTLKHLTHRFSPLFLTAFQAFVGALFFAAVMLLTGTPLPDRYPLAPTLAILYLGVAVTFAAYGLYNFGVSRIPASQAALFVNLIPLFAVLLAWAILGDRLGWQELLGGAVILVGVAIAQFQAPEEVEKILEDHELPRGS